MAEEVRDVQPESSQALEAAMEASATSEEQQVQDTETATPQEAESQEQEQPQGKEQTPFHEHPRFKEVIDEKNYWRDMAMKQMNSMQQSQSPQQIQQTARQQETLPGNTPEEREFWRMVRTEAERIADQKIQQVNPLLEAGRMELAQMKVAQFRSAHPDIKPNSPEEVAIAERIQSGYTPEDAYRAVMWDRKFQESQTRSTQQTKQKIIQKRQANVETRPSVSQASQPAPKRTIDETFNHYWGLAEQGKLPG